MLDKAQTIEKLQSSRQYLSEHYGVSSMLLFGSVARNEQKEDSDVDVCVEMKPNLFKQAGVKVYLQELLGCSVDVVRLRENMNQLFKQQILKYGVRVYWNHSKSLWDPQVLDTRDWYQDTKDRTAPLCDSVLRKKYLYLRKNSIFAKNAAHNDRRLRKNAYLCIVKDQLAMKYNELENNVVSVTDTETMDLETARQLLHQMVKEVYAQQW